MCLINFFLIQDTLIVWSEGDNFDLALSFQEKAGCDEIWEKICAVQGKDPSVDITQVCLTLLGIFGICWEYYCGQGRTDASENFAGCGGRVGG